jgi:hypothetical protein
MSKQLNGAGAGSLRRVLDRANKTKKRNGSGRTEDDNKAEKQFFVVVRGWDRNNKNAKM